MLRKILLHIFAKWKRDSLAELKEERKSKVEKIKSYSMGFYDNGFKQFAHFKVSPSWSNIEGLKTCVGSHRLLLDNEELTIIEYKLQKGSVIPRHNHKGEFEMEYLIVLNGSIVYEFDKEVTRVRGYKLFPAERPHVFRCDEDSKGIIIWDKIQNKI